MKNEETANFAPQRQSPIGLWVEILYSLQSMVKTFWPLFIYLLVRFTELEHSYKLSGLGLFILIGVLIGYLKYRNFLFSIDQEREEFIVQSGIVNKKRSVVQLHKIQQVSINQSFIQKLIGVYGIEIETAGSIKNEVTIKAVSKDEALKIKARLLKNKRQSAVIEETTSSTPKTSLFIKISQLSLFKTGITSHYLESSGLMIAFFYTIFSNLKDAGFIRKDAEKSLFTDLNPTTVLNFAILLIGGLIILTLLFNVIRIMVVYHDFHISRTENSLLLSYGLFTNKNTMINPDKVQIIRSSSNYFQKKLNSFQLSIHQASSDIARDKKANIRIPGCSKVERDAILAFIYGKEPQKGLQISANARKIIGPIISWIIIPILIMIMILSQYPTLGNFLYFTLPYFALVTPLIYFNYRNYSLFIHNDFIFKQSGIWDIKTEIIETYKIQAISTKQNVWHRKADIGHVTLHTAGGDIQFKFTNYSVINRYVNHWLYQVETSTKDWM